MNHPELETARLLLRPFDRGDVDDLHRLWVDPDVRRYLWDDEVIPKERVAEIVAASLAFFEAEGFGLWAVFLRGGRALAGFCGFWHFHDPPRLQLLYGIAPSCWNRGLATEVAAAMLKYGFEELGFGRIEASTDAPNLASIRVMEKAGMSFEKSVTAGGLETVYYSISREDYSLGAGTGGGRAGPGPRPLVA